MVNHTIKVIKSKNKYHYYDEHGKIIIVTRYKNIGDAYAQRERHLWKKGRETPEA